MKKIIVSLLVVATCLMSCKNTSKTEKDNLNRENTKITETTENEWQYLFDGKSIDGWRGFNETELPEGWILEEGTLKSLGKGGDIGGDIVYGSTSFGEFELYLEWKISEGGNSGIFYHVVEGEVYDAPYMNAPEYQLIDQIGYPQKLEPWQSIGADYGMYDPYFEGVVRNVGEWNTSRIIFTKERVSYWLNGKKTVEFVPWSADWDQRKNGGKWKDFPDYGMATSGLIGLQDHGSFIWFKNIKIKKL